MTVKFESEVTLTSERFLPVFMITWFYTGLGAVLALSFFILAGIFPKESLLFTLIHNLAIFIFFISLLAGYTGVYRAVNSSSEKVSIRSSIKDSLGLSRYIAAVSFIMVLLFSAVVAIETLFSMVSMIPYAGASIMAILTAPIFLLNIFIVIISVCVFAVAPSVISDTDGLKNIILEIKNFIIRDWLKIIFYLLLSLTLLALGLVLILIVIRYAGGITKAVQWKIMIVYPSSVNNLISGSFFSDLIYRVVPSGNPMLALQQYGENLATLLKIIKHILEVSFILIITLTASFPLAVYFSISAVYFRKLRKQD